MVGEVAKRRKRAKFDMKFPHKLYKGQDLSIQDGEAFFVEPLYSGPDMEQRQLGEQEKLDDEEPEEMNDEYLSGMMAGSEANDPDYESDKEHSHSRHLADKADGREEEGDREREKEVKKGKKANKEGKTTDDEGIDTGEERRDTDDKMDIDEEETDTDYERDIDEEETDTDEDNEQFELKLSEVPEKIDWGIKRRELATLCGNAVAYHRRLPFRYIMTFARTSNSSIVLSVDREKYRSYMLQVNLLAKWSQSYQGTTKSIAKDANILVATGWAKRKSSKPLTISQPRKSSSKIETNEECNTGGN